jgi:hypothetical protein
MRIWSPSHFHSYMSPALPGICSLPAIAVNMLYVPQSVRLACQVLTFLAGTTWEGFYWKHGYCDWLLQAARHSSLPLRMGDDHLQRLVGTQGAAPEQSVMDTAGRIAHSGRETKACEREVGRNAERCSQDTRGRTGPEGQAPVDWRDAQSLLGLWPLFSTAFDPVFDTLCTA